jgi:hypothetical protein
MAGSYNVRVEIEKESYVGHSREPKELGKTMQL